MDKFKSLNFNFQRKTA